MKTTLVLFDSPQESLNGLLRGVVALLLIVAFDAIWLTIMKNQYKSVITNVSGSNTGIRYQYAIVSWIIIASALAVQLPNSVYESMAYGALAGFVMYGVFNTVNASIFSDWNIGVVLYDTAWGTFNCMITAIILYYIFHKE